MDVSIIEFLRQISNPVIDWIFYAITQIGGLYFFIGIAAILYWSINKKYAHKFVLTFLIVSLVNIGLKSIFKRPRPYTLSSIESPFGYETTGYSFPSGHASNAAVLGYASIDAYKTYHYKWLRNIGYAIMILVPISRMVLAQHYLTDVIVGLVISYIGAIYLYRLIDRFNNKEEYITLLMMPVILIAMILIKNEDLYVGAGAFSGFAIGYYVEKHYIKYQVKTKLNIQIFKIMIGLIGVVLIKEGLKFIFPETYFFDFIRYLLIGGWVAGIAPLTFKYVFKHQES
jgi:undecaprenyl-diphosphatase